MLCTKGGSMTGVLKQHRVYRNYTSVSKCLNLFIITLALTGIVKTASAQQNVTGNDTSVVRHKELVNTNGLSAQYPGGVDQFYKYILTNITPDATCVPGKMVYVYFVVGKDGAISKAKIRSKMLSEEMRKQIIAVFEKAPKWTPAQQNGNIIRESFVCPVMFMGNGTTGALAKN